MNNELTNWTRRQHSFCWSNAVPYLTMQVSYYQNAKAHPKVLKRISKHADPNNDSKFFLEYWKGGMESRRMNNHLTFKPN